MAEFIQRCPYCDAEFEVQDEWLGMKVECPQCNQKFVIKKQVSISSGRIPKSNFYAEKQITNTERRNLTSASKQPSQQALSGLERASRFLCWIIVLSAIAIGILLIWLLCNQVPTNHSSTDIDYTSNSDTSYPNSDAESSSTSNTSYKNSDTKSSSTSNTSYKNSDTESSSTSNTSHKNSDTESSSKKNLPVLEFLGISVNESEKNIKAHLLRRGFTEDNVTSEGKWHIGKEVLKGKFWLLDDHSGINAHISFDSGRIMVTFDNYHSFLIRVRMKMQDSRLDFSSSLGKYNSYLSGENTLMQQYFATLKNKYGQSQGETFILLDDGLIEFISKDTKVIDGIYFTGTPNQYNCVIFYNRQAAEKKLQENRKKLDDLNRRFNDI